MSSEFDNWFLNSVYVDKPELRWFELGLTRTFAEVDDLQARLSPASHAYFIEAIESELSRS